MILTRLGSLRFPVRRRRRGSKLAGGAELVLPPATSGRCEKKGGGADGCLREQSTAAVHEATQTPAAVPTIFMGERRTEERECCGVYWFASVSLSNGPERVSGWTERTRARVLLDPNRSNICVSFGSNRARGVSVFKIGRPTGCSFDPTGRWEGPFLDLGPRVGDALRCSGECRGSSMSIPAKKTRGQAAYPPVHLWFWAN
jgi:hypothetical protein